MCEKRSPGGLFGTFWGPRAPRTEKGPQKNPKGMDLGAFSEPKSIKKTTVFGGSFSRAILSDFDSLRGPFSEHFASKNDPESEQARTAETFILHHTSDGFEGSAAPGASQNRAKRAARKRSDFQTVCLIFVSFWTSFLTPKSL